MVGLGFLVICGGWWSLLIVLVLWFLYAYLPGILCFFLLWLGVVVVLYLLFAVGLLFGGFRVSHRFCDLFGLVVVWVWLVLVFGRICCVMFWYVGDFCRVLGSSLWWCFWVICLMFVVLCICGLRFGVCGLWVGGARCAVGFYGG